MTTHTKRSRPAHACPLNRFGSSVRVLLAIFAFSLGTAPSAMAKSRGELLYDTHCITCHTTEMHWRDQRSAKDWAGLKVQVRRWQAAASLAWSEADILAVARYLNASVYHFEQTTDPVLSWRLPGHESVSMLSRQALRRRP
jgi:mono/diheme cytochrome c family protein